MSYDNTNRSGVRVFSVTMTESELRLFSEFLDQKNFNDEVDEAIRKATRGELSEIDAKIAAIEGWDESTGGKSKSAQKAIDLAREDPMNDEKFNRAKDYTDRFADSVDHSDQIVEQRRKALLDLNKVSKERNERELSSIAGLSRNNQSTYNPKVREVSIIDSMDEIEEEPTPLELQKQRNAKLGIPEKLQEVDPVVREDTAEIRKIKRDNLKEKYTNKARQGVDYAKRKTNQGIDYVKDKYNALDDKYDELFGRDLGRDAAIAAGATAALGASAYGVHRYLKNKKKNKEEAEKKYTTSDKKKK